MTTPILRRARSLADLGAGSILATVEIAAAPERVFRAISTDEITRWWGAPELYQSTAYTADLRVGGRWRSDGKGADGQPFFVEGEFLEIDPPRRLVQTWCAPWDGMNRTTITWQLDAIAGGTRVTLHHTGFAERRDQCANHGNGWERVLGWLDDFVGGRAERYFLIRLLPPRPTFMQDMSEDERAMMTRHVAYWRGKLADGTALVFGPVADPAGGWGVGVVRVHDEAEVRALEAADPAVAAGRGLRYEILPMVRAVHQG